MQSVNPFTGQIIKTYEEYNSDKVKTIIRQVDTTFHQWKLTSFEYRSTLLKNLQARLLEKKRGTRRYYGRRNGQSSS